MLNDDSIVQHARKYIRWGWRVVPIPSRKKAPTLKGWTKLRLSESDVDAYFDEDDNIGVLLGEPSRGLVDVDLDCKESIFLAPFFLPVTGRIHGRKSAKDSHYWYRVAPLLDTIKFQDTDGDSIAEIRSTGSQTVVPPSIHPTGERLRWFKKAKAARVTPEGLLHAVRQLAACSLIARHWPNEGSRNDAALALAGVLLRAGWDEEEASEFISLAAQAAHDEECKARRLVVKATRHKLDKKARTTGRPRLAKIIGTDVVNKVYEWLGIDSDADGPAKDIEIRRFPRLRTITIEEEFATKAVFRSLHDYVISQIHFTHDWQPTLVSLWAMGTYLYMQFPCYGHLWLNSPTTHSGKSKLLSVLWTVCYKATEPQLEPTSAALFRFPSVIGGTLLLDEVDNLDPQKRSEVISILNHYNSTGVVLRATPGKNKKFTLEKLPVYCPKVIAGINNLPATLQDRCIKISLHRKMHSEKVQRFMPGSFEALKPLRDQLEAWALRDALRIIGAYQKRNDLSIPLNVDDRARDILEPLFAIASVLPTWVKDKLLDATNSIAEERSYEEQESNAVVQGLQVLKHHFPERTTVWNLRTETALEHFSEEIPSIETRAQAQALLRRFGFRSKTCRFGKRVLRAYEIPLRRLEKLLDRYGLNARTA